MPRVRVEPSGIEFEAQEGQTVAEAAFAQGYYWPVGCDFIGQCSNCAMEVLSGLGRLSPMGRNERYNLIRQRGPRALENPRLRLACQAAVYGDVIVHKRGVRPDTMDRV